MASTTRMTVHVADIAEVVATIELVSNHLQEALDKLKETESEIVRHHRDFKRISDLLDVYFRTDYVLSAEEVLRTIRSIVG